MSAAVLQMLLLLVIMAALVVPVGNWLYGVFAGEKHTAPERLTYRLLGVNPAEGMDWKRYGLVLVVSNLVMLLLSYLLIRLQGLLPWNPAALKAQAPDLAWNTAVSFMTNTNWQAYSGENLAYTVQFAGLAVQNFVSAATGIAVAVALVRGFAYRRSGTIGNFWVDLTRTTVRVLLPLSVLGALALAAWLWRAQLPGLVPAL